MGWVGLGWAGLGCLLACGSKSRAKRERLELEEIGGGGLEGSIITASREST